MGRLHLVELEDLRWFPAVVRDAGTAYLEKLARIGGHGGRVRPLLDRALAASPEKTLIDLCSGGGGAILAAREALAEAGHDVAVELTDFYPNRAALERAQASAPGRVHANLEAIDARAVPGRLVGVRTIFNALHHFRPDDARSILADAARARQPVVVVEAVRRHPALFLFLLLVAPLLPLLVVPLLRPFDWRWLPLTYLLPAIPFLVLWDGVVSCLRVYSPDELRALVAGIDAPDYEWEAGDLPIGGPVPAVYLLGRPRPA